jgi:hypothetical protein
MEIAMTLLQLPDPWQGISHSDMPAQMTHDIYNQELLAKSFMTC